MTIKVVEQQKEMQCTCRQCGSVLAYVFTDVRTVTYKDISQCTSTDHYIDCPVCSKRIIIKSY